MAVVKQTPFHYYTVEDGLITDERPKRLEQVYKWLVKELRKHNENGDEYSIGPFDEYFSPMREVSHWPMNYHWISVFAVTGGSEGHYVHVEAITGDIRELLFLGKTFRGMDNALHAVSLLTKLLEC